tara:strand:- start:36 stop:410 length:375 start_codon:yes stop_codon:yes gene_type:complete
MLKTYFIFLFFITIFSVQTLNATCGSCVVDKNKVKSSFIEEIPANGKVNGKMLASCGMCNFDTNDRSCGLSVKIGHHIYSVANVNIDDHIDSHAKDGFCNVVRVVNVKGKVKNNKLYADKFSIK